MSQKYGKETREKLLENGKKLFAAKGFKHTGIREIVELTDISIGTYYSYFDSKEELFLNVYLIEQKNAHYKIQKEFVEMFDAGKEPIEILKRLIYSYYGILENNQILSQTIDPDLTDKIIKKLEPEQKEEFDRNILEAYLPYIKKCQEDGKIIDIKVELLIEIINASFYLRPYKEKIGEEIYLELIDYLINANIEGLKPEER